MAFRFIQRDSTFVPIDEFNELNKDEMRELLKRSDLYETRKGTGVIHREKALGIKSGMTPDEIIQKIKNAPKEEPPTK